MASYIGQIAPTEENDETKQTECEVCEQYSHELSYCYDCAQIICVNCCKPHSKILSTKHHRVTSLKCLKASKQPETATQIVLLKTECKVIDDTISANKARKVKIDEMLQQRLKKFEQLKGELLLEMENHLMKIRDQIVSAQNESVQQIENRCQKLRNYKETLESHINLLAECSKGVQPKRDGDTSDRLIDQAQRELRQIQSDTARLQTGTLPEVKVIHGGDWDQVISTRVEVKRTSAVKSFVGSSTMLGDNTFQKTYKEVKRIDIKYYPTKLFLDKDRLWVAVNDKHLLIYNLNLIKQKIISHKQLKHVESVTVAGNDVIVCNRHTGLHQLTKNGENLTFIMLGSFSDCSFVQNQLFVLENKNGVVFVLKKENNRWLKSAQLQLSGYEGSINDKLCASSTCLYVSSCEKHCILVYTLSGEFLYKTGESGRGTGIDTVGQFHFPRVAGMDNNGNLFVCDNWNHRLQVLDTDKRNWSLVHGLEDLKVPVCAAVDSSYLWVGSGSGCLIKYELI